MAIKDTDSLELLDRFDYLMKDYVPLAAELAPKLEQFGKYRRELQFIAAELKERGIEAQDKEELRQVIEDAINKKEPQEIDEPKPNTPQRYRKS